MSENKCDEILEMLPLWAGGDLPDEDLETVEEHLSRCGQCRAAGDSWRKDLSRVVALMGEDAGPQLDPDFRTRAIGLAQASSGLRSRRRFWPIAASLAAVLAVFLLWHGVRPDRSSPVIDSPNNNLAVSWEELQVIFEGCLSVPVALDDWKAKDGAGLIAVLSPDPSGHGFIVADCIESANLARVSNFPWLEQRLNRYRKTNSGEREILIAVCLTGERSRAYRRNVQKNTLMCLVDGV